MIFNWSNRTHVIRFFILIAVLVAGCLRVAAQTASQYDRGTPPQHAAGVSSIGSYISADLGTINLSNGSLNFNIPVGSVGGRGFWVPLTLNYTSKVWSASTGKVIASSNSSANPPMQPQPIASAVYNDAAQAEEIYNRVGPGWTVGAAPYIKMRGMGISPHENVINNCINYTWVLVKLTVVFPDKGEIEFRDDMWNGAPLSASAFGNPPCQTQDGNRGNRWNATDGSGAVFYSDNSNGVVKGDLEGVLIMADGMRYRFTNTGAPPAITAGSRRLGRCTSITDRNGNTVRIDYPNSHEVKYTDQLGRITTVDINNPALGSVVVRVTLPGYNGAQRVYDVKSGVMNQNYRADQVTTLEVINGDYDPLGLGFEWPRPHIDLYSESYGPGLRIDNLKVVTELSLPDGRSLKFKYNRFGEVAELEMPTGGKVQYDYKSVLNYLADGEGLPAGNSLECEVSPRPSQTPCNVEQIDRAVTARRTYPTGNTSATAEGNWTYKYLRASGETDARTEVKCVNAQNEVLLYERHYFMQAERYLTLTTASMDGTGYAKWTTGLERRSEMLASNGTTVLSASEQDWTQRQTIVGSGKWTTGHSIEEIANDNRVNVTRKYLDDGTTMSKVVTSYDQASGDDNHINNPSQIEEYDFDQTLKRKTTLSYMTGTSYTTGGPNSANLLSLVTDQSVYEGAAEKSHTSYEYDNYTAGDGNHLPLESYGSDFASIPGHKTSYDNTALTRGNPTKVTTKVDATTNIISYTRYDVLGNIVSVKDGRGNVSQIDYKDDFGNGSNPGLNAGGHTSYSLPTKLTSPPPNTGESSHVAYSQYDYSTGLMTGFKDRNGVITQTFYTDPFDRPSLIKVALGTNVEAHTKMYYAGTADQPPLSYGVTLSANDLLTAKDQVEIADGNLRSWTHTDGFGRTTESWTSDPQGDVKVVTTYDALNRAIRVTNPHRSTSEATYGFADTTYDLAGRVKTVTTSDGAVVKTDYNGPRVLVTDQAGKQRISKTDGLGRLTDVWEITAADTATEAVAFPSHSEVTAGYRTKYKYDVLDNLIEVKQQVSTTGSTQTRSFAYDSLKRLTSALNPESGQVTYTYDENSNLKTKTDGRTPALTTTYTYDALNRVRSKSYSDSTSAVTYGYEKDQSGSAVTNAIGRMTFVSAAVSTTSYTQFDPLGQVLQSKQATQAGGSQSYTLSYEYNLAGQMTSETYPSLKKVVTSYDSAGRISEVKDEALNKEYASGLSYAAHGVVQAMRLGNDLIEATSFNSRLQPVQIKLGTGASPSSGLQLDYSYGVRVSGVVDVTKNNGNVERQTISFTGLNAQQSYTYDALNRLKTMSELGGWSQTYSYDRYGNRWVSGGNVPSPQQTPQSQTSFDAATNKIKPSVMAGFGYDAVGNLTSDPQTPTNGIVYDGENRQTSYTKLGVGATSYSYDGDGRRVKKVTGSPQVTTVYVYDVMGKLVAEYTDAQQQPAGGTKYLTADHLGSTRVVTGQNQSVVARYDYLPFGEEMGAGVGSRTVAMGYGGSDTTRQKFTSKERDMESGLDYFGARYYSSAQGRFTSADEPFAGQDEEDPQTWNLYAYTSNNPLNRHDPDGRRWFYKQEGKKITDIQWVDANDDGTYTSPGEGYTEFIPTKERPSLFAINQKGTVGYFFGETADGAPKVTGYATGMVQDATMGLVVDYLLAKGIGKLAQSAFNSWRAWRIARAAEKVAEAGKSASERLANLAGKGRAEARQILEKEGFQAKGTTQGGYEKWYHPDGSRVQLRPNGEVVRTAPKTTPTGGGNTYRPRIGPDGKPTSTHNTGERVSGS